MDKRQGILAGAILAVALLFRPMGANAPQSGNPSNSVPSASDSNTSAATKSTASEGPWLASCGYWAAARDPDTYAENSGKNRQFSAIKINIYTNPAASSDPGCGYPSGADWERQRWGFPHHGPQPHITALIVTVPDPVHTHLAMSFDRIVAAVLRAATDEGYLESYFWLPWQRRPGALKPAVATGNQEPGHDPVRERQPGLIILKYEPEPSDNASPTDYSPTSSYYKVIYLFLVAESPTKGVEGFQLQNALAYESELGRILPNSHFSTGKDGKVWIIGPEYSGSAASLRAGMEEAGRQDPSLKFEAVGQTSTRLAMHQLADPARETLPGLVEYHSMAADGDCEDALFASHLLSSGYETDEIALLTEDTTLKGNAEALRQQLDPSRNPGPSACPKTYFKHITVIRYPLEISLLRNSEVENKETSVASSEAEALRPYLPFSVKDTSDQDLFPQFSPEGTPLSQEAQLITIARELRRSKFRIIRISASNPLDEIFLAQFLHRLYPDAQLVLGANDNLMERDIDNIPFIGSISIGPYPLLGIGGASNAPRSYTDSESVAKFNATKLVFWKAISPPGAQTNCSLPEDRLKDYIQPAPDQQDTGAGAAKRENCPEASTQGRKPARPALWATALGWDGYYPLGALDFTGGGDGKDFLPRVDLATGKLDPPDNSTQENEQYARGALGQLGDSRVLASLEWILLADFVILLCLVHIAVICFADYWSRLTRDLALEDNVHPQRRSTYIHVSTAALTLLALTISLPMVSLTFWFYVVSGTLASALHTTGYLDNFIACFLLVCGLATARAAFRKTRRYIRRSRDFGEAPQEIDGDKPFVRWLRCHFFFRMVLITWSAAGYLGLIWAWICFANLGSHSLSVYLQGYSFSFRCIHPLSLVSPLLPVVLLLFGWYLWGLFQTLRLRFSEESRVHLTDNADCKLDDSYLVSDQSLNTRDSKSAPALYENIECLMITRKLWQRMLPQHRGLVDLAVALACSLGYVLLCVYWRIPPRSFDHFLWKFGVFSTPYEFVVAALALPLVWVAVAGWLRLILIWRALRKGLLRRLEDQPIRFAFDRLSGMGWMTMLSRVGLTEQWRDMDRCIESMNHLILRHELWPQAAAETGAGSGTEATAGAPKELKNLQSEILSRNRLLRQRALDLPCKNAADARELDLAQKTSGALLTELDSNLAEFGKKLLDIVLIPRWQKRSSGLVASRGDENPSAQKALSDSSSSLRQMQSEPGGLEDNGIRAAEEFIAIRYFSLIRAVLANMRYLMTFISLTFVLTIVAWDSYPFQPRQFMDYVFTFLLAGLGTGIISVFAQMHRDPILSRLTDTKPNELGWDFYLRIVSYGAIPVCTWLAYQFPEIGGAIYRILQPGTSVFK